MPAVETSRINGRDTRSSLLSRLRNSSDRTQFETAWRQFYEKYTAPMYGWCRKVGLSHDDADDVVHKLMVRLVTELKKFNYDPQHRFRAWLKTVTRNAAIDAVRSNARVVLEDGSKLGEAVSSESIQEQLDRAFELELLAEARERVRQRLVTTEKGARNWDIFVATTDDNESAASVAHRLGVKRQLVYVEKNRVLERLKHAVSELAGDISPAAVNQER